MWYLESDRRERSGKDICNNILIKKVFRSTINKLDFLKLKSKGTIIRDIRQVIESEKNSLLTKHLAERFYLEYTERWKKNKKPLNNKALNNTIKKKDGTKSSFKKKAEKNTKS